MKNAIAPVAGLEFHLRLLNGPEQGVSFKLVSPKISIGRDPENDIAIPYDPKCSRQHAIIQYKEGVFTISGKSEKNRLLVDGVHCETAILHDNSLISIGDTQLQFRAQSHLPQELVQVPMGPQTMASYEAVQSPLPKAGSPRKTRRPKGSKSPIPRFAIYAGIGFMLYLLLSSPSDKKEEVQLRTEEQVTAAMEEVNQSIEEARTEFDARRPKSPAEREAQSVYIRGFRDYKKGQFGRASESFQACLSLDPSHSLCNRYLRLSQRRNSELIQKQMLLGRSYKDQNQFSSCIAAFRDVMILVKDTSSTVYQEAKRNHDDCRIRLQERF